MGLTRTQHFASLENHKHEFEKTCWMLFVCLGSLFMFCFVLFFFRGLRYKTCTGLYWQQLYIDIGILPKFPKSNMHKHAAYTRSLTHISMSTTPLGLKVEISTGRPFKFSSNLLMVLQKSEATCSYDIFIKECEGERQDSPPYLRLKRC